MKAARPAEKACEGSKRRAPRLHAQGDVRPGEDPSLPGAHREDEAAHGKAEKACAGKQATRTRLHAPRDVRQAKNPASVKPAPSGPRTREQKK